MSLAIKGQQLVVQKKKYVAETKAYMHLGAFLAPSRAKKLKVAFHQFHPSVLLEECVKFWPLFSFYRLLW